MYLLIKKNKQKSNLWSNIYLWYNKYIQKHWASTDLKKPECVCVQKCATEGSYLDKSWGILEDWKGRDKEWVTFRWIKKRRESIEQGKSFYVQRLYTGECIWPRQFTWSKLQKRKRDSGREIDLEGLVGESKNLSLDPEGNAKLLKHSESSSGQNFRKTSVGLSWKNIRFCDKNRLYTLKYY